MNDSEFGSLDPRDLAAYLSAWENKNRREDYRFATIVCSILNLFTPKGKKAIGPADVFPSLDTSPKGLSEDELAEKIRSVAVSLGAAEVVE